MEQIIKQPNGLYALFSSNVDNFTVYDATPEEIINIWLEEKTIEVTDKVTSIVEALKRNEKPYYQFTLSFDEALATIKKVHGDDELRRLALQFNAQGKQEIRDMARK